MLGRVAKVEEYLVAGGTPCDTSVGTVYATTTYAYNVLDNLTTITDAQTNGTSFVYDSLRRRTQMVDPDLGTWQYGYDAAGNLRTQTDAKGQTITFSYDSLNRLTQKDYAGTAPIDVQSTYDQASVTLGKGRLTQVTKVNSSGSTIVTLNFNYDALGRVVKRDQTMAGTTYSTQASFDGIGRLLTATYPPNPNSLTVKYDYQAGPWLACVYEGTSCAAATVQYAQLANYTALGQPGTVTYGNGVATTFTYSQASNPTCSAVNFQLCTLVTAKGSTSYQNLTYGYDAGGNITAITDTILGNQAFGYDGLDRLTSANGPYGSQTYAYSQLGNLTQNPLVGAMAYPASGIGSVRPHAVCATGTSSCASPTYQYDLNGNLTSNPNLSSLVYDFENRPTSITKSGVTTTITYHDLLGRVTKTASGSTTTYVGPFYECTGGSCTKYIFAGDQRIALKQGSTVTYVHPDHLSSSSVLTNGTDGSKNELVTYYPFGQTRTDTDGTGTPLSPGFRYKYTDQEFDDTTGLYYYQARYYDPVLGRFVQPDSIIPDLFGPQALNPYSYVLNNPLRYTDPSGLQAQPGDPGFIGPLQPPILLPEIVVYAAQDPALYTFGNITTSTNPATFSFAPGSATAMATPPQPGITPYRPAAFPPATTGERVEQSLQLFGSFAGPPVVAGLVQTGRFVSFFERLFQPFRSILGRGGRSAEIARRFALLPERARLLARIVTPQGELRASRTVAEQLAGDRTYIPTQSILDVVGSGRRVADPQGVPGQFLFTAPATFNESQGVLEVLVHEPTGDIRHVLFRSFK